MYSRRMETLLFSRGKAKTVYVFLLPLVMNLRVCNVQLVVVVVLCAVVLTFHRLDANPGYWFPDDAIDCKRPFHV